MVNTINEVFIDRIFVMNDSGVGVTGLVNGDFIKTLKRNKSATGETITVTEDANGYYYVEFTPIALGTYSYIVSNTTYQAEGWYNDVLIRTYSNDDLQSDISTINTNLLRALGLMQENIYIDTQVFDGNGSLTSARLRTYSTSGDVGTTTNVLATYTMTSTYDGSNRLSSYKMVKE